VSTIEQHRESRLLLAIRDALRALSLFRLSPHEVALTSAVVLLEKQFGYAGNLGSAIQQLLHMPARVSGVSHSLRDILPSLDSAASLHQELLNGVRETEVTTDIPQLYMELFNDFQ
ncbi:hypothetical protein PFISCL1PPCAC_20173, partial [Pristionchus fissidentatus]